MNLDNPRVEQGPVHHQQTPKERIRTLLAFAAYITLTLILSAYHEPWRDEAESWLIVRDESLPVVLHTANYAGTPILWNLVLAPFAKAGAPYTAQRFLHLVIAISATGLLLFRSPFPFALRLALIFGSHAGGHWFKSSIVHHYTEAGGET